jgi:hypothetical protein
MTDVREKRTDLIRSCSILILGIHKALKKMGCVLVGLLVIQP